jgi:hypothetical protein
MTIDDLTPEQAIEVQEFYLLRDTKRRNFRDSGQPERRGLWAIPEADQPAPRKPWPQPWGSNSLPVGMRSQYAAYYRAERPGSGKYGNTNGMGRNKLTAG